MDDGKRFVFFSVREDGFEIFFLVGLLSGLGLFLFFSVFVFFFLRSLNKISFKIFLVSCTDYFS